MHIRIVVSIVLIFQGCSLLAGPKTRSLDTIEGRINTASLAQLHEDLRTIKPYAKHNPKLKKRVLEVESEIQSRIQQLTQPIQVHQPTETLEQPIDQQYEQEFRNTPYSQLFLHAQNLNAELAKLSFENPEGPTSEWLNMKKKYDHIMRKLKTDALNLDRAEGGNQYAHELTFIDRTDASGDLALLYNIWLDRIFKSQGIPVINFKHGDSKLVYYEKNEFDQLYSVAVSLIQYNKDRLALAVRKKNSEYYRFAQTYVNQMNKTIKIFCLKAGTYTYGDNYRNSPQAQELVALATLV